MKERIAVATRDGKSVNAHFGKTPFFFVFDVEDGEITLESRRDAVAVKQKKFAHDKGTLDQILDLIGDCQSVVVQKIGHGAAIGLLDRHVRVYEAQGPVDLVLKQISQTKARNI